MLSSSLAAIYGEAGGFSYKTFVPAPVTVGMCSGTPNYENFSSTWERAKAWLKLVGLFTNFRDLSSVVTVEEVEGVVTSEL